MKPKKVIFVSDSLQINFDKLDDNDPLKKSLIRSIKSIQENIFVGRSVKKKLIPKRLTDKYHIDNLWIYNLPEGWRMLYSLTRSYEIEIITVILDWMSHKDYEKLFNFG